MKTCHCFKDNAFPDGDLADFFTPDEEERFICARCHLPLHHATLIRLRRHQQALERTASDPRGPHAPGLEPRDWCRVCRRSHRWVA